MLYISDVASAKITEATVQRPLHTWIICSIVIGDAIPFVQSETLHSLVAAGNWRDNF